MAEIPGLIAGIGPEATIACYRSILRRYAQESGQAHAPNIILNSTDMRKQLDFVEAEDFEGLSNYLAAAVDQTARAGTTFAAITACTPHIVFDAIARRSSIPLISIVDVTRDHADQLGVKKAALFGARFTMQGDFFQTIFSPRGIAVVSPSIEELDYIHEKYFSELVKGIVLPETRSGLLDIVEAMQQRDGIGALILGGTDLSLMFEDDLVFGMPVLDSSAIHVRAIMSRLLE